VSISVWYTRSLPRVLSSSRSMINLERQHGHAAIRSRHRTAARARFHTCTRGRLFDMPETHVARTGLERSIRLACGALGREGCV
jgi:hypothetical protein